MEKCPKLLKDDVSDMKLFWYLNCKQAIMEIQIDSIDK